MLARFVILFGLLFFGCAAGCEDRPDVRPIDCGPWGLQPDDCLGVRVR